MQMLYVCVICVHPMAVLNTAFCMTCSLFMLVEDARGIPQSWSHNFLVGSHECLHLFTPHVALAVTAFMICRGLCVCTEMLWMCVLYVSFWSKARPITFGCVAMGSTLWCIFYVQIACIYV